MKTLLSVLIIVVVVPLFMAEGPGGEGIQSQTKTSPQAQPQQQSQPDKAGAVLVPLTFGPEKPANAVQNSTKPVVWLSVSGHWRSLDPKNPVAGFSVSEISCSKPGLDGDAEGGCHENASTIIPNVGLQVSTDHNDYEIVSWRADGLTARYVGGACRIAHTIEVDFKSGIVTITDGPTAKTLSNKVCKDYGTPASYQLMEGESFKIEEDKNGH